MRIFFTTLLLASILTAGLAQTVRRVNNNPGITGTNVYSTFALAHTAAAANDIIIIEPSPTSYGSIILTKPLKIYGNGYYLDINTELKVDRRLSEVGVIEFNTGSGGSEIYGLTILGTNVIYGVSNITISRCNISANSVSIVNTNKAGTTTNNVSNIFISRTYSQAGGSYFVQANPSSGFTISNVQITNNLIAAPGVQAGNTVGIQNWIVRHNTFLTGAIATLANAVFENNLLLAGGGVAFSNVTFNNNVSTGSTFPSESEVNDNRNNYALTDPETSVSQLVGTGTGISPDEQYQLKPGADLKTLGSGGSEVGAYGGVTPYVISGIPPIPSIVDLINTGTGDNANPLKIKISVKSNN